jgi:ABC-type nickel/cobalt efflux system permease component RcnA
MDVLFQPVESLDEWLTSLIDGAPLLVALAIAFVLGLRHASDPDHLVAVSSLVAADDGDVRAATRLGAWWGSGHALTLLVVGLPLIALKEQLPAWLERGAETGVGLVILALGVRVLVKWLRGDYRASPHHHHEHDHRHLRHGEGSAHHHRHVRSPRQAFGIGMLHGLAGTGAVVVLLIAALPGRVEAAAALAVFAPMSIVSMAIFTSAFAWVLTRPVVAPLYRTVLVPALGAFGLVFGLWYAGIT